MHNLIRINIEEFHPNIETILSCYFESKGHKLVPKSVHIVDRGEFCECERDRFMAVRYGLEGVQGHIHAQTGEELPEHVEIERKHMQYNFDTHTMYGFYKLVLVGHVKGVDVGDMWTELATISKDLLIEGEF